MALKYRWFGFVSIVGLFLDQLTKHWIVDRFYYGERLVVIPGLFDLTHVRNPGGAFSLFADGPFEWRMFFFVGATVLGYIVFADFPDGWTWLGAAIIVGSGIYIMRRETIRRREARQAGDGRR